MEPLLKQLKELPARLAALPAATRLLLGGALAAALLVAVAVSFLTRGGDDWRYAFTNLAPEDGTEVAAQLKGAGIPFRLEAEGAALAVPADKVYDTRLALAAAGLPRSGGVGFELFDHGDLGVSEFTQRVNLQRALEGELARTIGSLSAVRNARVHVTLAEKGLYRDEDRAAAASVVLNLRPGRSLGPKELAGVRHLVASAVAGLEATRVTVVDGSGTVLAEGDGEGASPTSTQRDLERDLEARVVGLLEPAVGKGAVVARVSVSLDTRAVSTRSEIYDPDASALRNERRTVQVRGDPTPGGVAGAAANQPGEAPGNQNANGSSSEDENRTWEISKTTTESTVREPRVERLSLAVLLDGVDGKPRSDEEVARLGELAKRAVGFDPGRGDQIEISSAVFGAAPGSAGDAPAPAAEKEKLPLLAIGGGAAALCMLGLGALVLRARNRRGRQVTLPPLRVGATVAELEADELPQRQQPERKALEDPDAALRERARQLALQDPTRAAHLLRAWIEADREASHG